MHALQLRVTGHPSERQAPAAAQVLRDRRASCAQELDLLFLHPVSGCSLEKSEEGKGEKRQVRRRQKRIRKAKRRREDGNKGRGSEASQTSASQMPSEAQPRQRHLVRSKKRFPKIECRGGKSTRIKIVESRFIIE